jgi:hypothetical protein
MLLVSDGNRTSLPMDDQDRFLEDARSIHSGSSFDQYPKWGNYGGVTSGRMSIIAGMTREKNVPVGVAPRVKLPDDAGVDEVDASQLARASYDGDEVAEDPASMEKDDQAPSMIFQLSQKQRTPKATADVLACMG